MENTEWCPTCDNPAIRQFVPKKLHIKGASVEHAEYNPGLGAVVKNKKHREELCKRNGVVEVGNDYKTSDTMQDTFDKSREEKLNKRYEDV